MVAKQNPLDPSAHELPADLCSIAATLDVIGDRWSLLILRNVFRGTRRFSEFVDDLGIARNLLTDRLNRLVDTGVLAKVPYQERPLRHEYRLTEKGADLSPALIALMQWGDRWYHPDTPPTVLVHSTCDTPLHHEVRCETCDGHVPPNQIRSRAGESRATTPEAATA